MLHVGRVVPVTITLKNLLEKNFAEEYAARREEEGPAPAPSDNAPLPLFVMACTLPGTCSKARSPACRGSLFKTEATEVARVSHSSGCS